MKIILASHGELAKGMKNTLSMIVGEQADIVAYSAYDEENVNFVQEIKTLIENKDDEQVVIVTDVMGGSVNTAMTEIILQSSDVFLVTGMNLPFVLSLATYMDVINIEVINKLVEEGKNGLINVNEMIKSMKEE